jgi:hypothetical protein
MPNKPKSDSVGNLKPKIEPIFTLTDFKRGNFAMPEYCYDADLQMSANIANTKIEKMLGPKVYGYEAAGIFRWSHNLNQAFDTHEAYIFAARPIGVPECVEHTPVCELEDNIHASTLSSGGLGWSFFGSDFHKKGWKCAKCGVQLTAKWIARE